MPSLCGGPEGTFPFTHLKPISSKMADSEIGPRGGTAIPKSTSPLFQDAPTQGPWD